MAVGSDFAARNHVIAGDLPRLFLSDKKRSSTAESLAALTDPGVPGLKIGEFFNVETEQAASTRGQYGPFGAPR